MNFANLSGAKMHKSVHRLTFNVECSTLSLHSFYSRKQKQKPKTKIKTAMQLNQSTTIQTKTEEKKMFGIQRYDDCYRPM